MSFRYSPGYRFLRRQLSANILLYRFGAKLLGNHQLANENTQLVLEGFPRSANSFFEAAVLSCDPTGRLQLSSHTHAAANILFAARENIPTVVLYRNPNEAIASYLEMLPAGFDPITLYKEYISFHRAALKSKSTIKFISFETATKDPIFALKIVSDSFQLQLRIPNVDSSSFIESVRQSQDSISLERVGRPPRYSKLREPDFLIERANTKNRIQRSLTCLSDHRAVVEAQKVYQEVMRIGT